MNSTVFDQRFCQVALDGLKSYGRTAFTLRFLRRHRLPAGRNLDEMWATIDRWVKQDPANCRALLEYVDELRMWGRQRVFLFEVDKEYVKTLASPDAMTEAIGAAFHEPIFRWEAEEPFVADAGHTTDPVTGAPLLVLKLIETRKYDLIVEGRQETFEERSTNFFIVNLKDRYAELRIQGLPTGAERSTQDERERLQKTLGRHLEMERFKPLDLEPVMDVLLHEHRYTVTASRLKFPEPAVPPDAPELVGFLERLFWRPEPAEVSAFWDCEQDVLGARQLHFTLSAAAGSIGFDGIADPAQVGEILATVVRISRNLDENGPIEPGIWSEGAVHTLVKDLADHPKAQAVLLSAGAIAASIIWIFAEAIGTYFYDELLAWLLRGLPVFVVTVPIEIAWVIFYYGWRRVGRGFKVLLSLSTPEVWRAISAARKRRRGQRPLAAPDE